MALSDENARLLADARADLPGAIPSGIQAAYFAALRDFLDFTNVWQEDIDVPLVAGTTSYVLAAPSVGRINRLLVLWDSQDTTGQRPWVDRVQMRTPGALVIATTPSAPAVWVATVAKTIKDPLDVDNNPLIDDWIIQKYWDTLLAGINCRMMMSPNKTYTNMPLGMTQGRKFLSGKTVARNEAIKANVRGQTNWAYPRPYNSSQRGM